MANDATERGRAKTFVIIGLVYPPRPQMDGAYVQQTLDLVGQERAVAGERVGFEAQETDTLAGDERDEALELFPDEG